MIQFGMRAHDICPKGSVTEVLDAAQGLGIRYIHLWGITMQASGTMWERS